MNEGTVYYRPEAGRPHLIMIEGKNVWESYLEGEQTLGRPSDNNVPDIAIASGVVSRRHGRFFTYAGSCRYCDDKSLNGTILNGERLEPGRTAEISDGDILRIHGRGDDISSLDVIMIYSDVREEAKEWTCLDISNAAEVVIGRNSQLRLNEQSVSRRHASIFRAQKGWALIDHGSVNGVFLNSSRVEIPVYLNTGDVIRIAGYYFVFRENCLLYQRDVQAVREIAEPAAQQAPVYEGPYKENDHSAGLSVYIEERNVWQRARKKTLLRDIQIDIPMGSMVLILGGSGAGKTTFMNAVMGYERAEGSISYAGTDIYNEYEQMKYEIGYVPQQDLLRMNDTVYDTLSNAAKMRLPVMPEDEYKVHIDETLKLLGLENLRDSLVVKLSGGQRKRLSIAVEYIGNPALFFLDEPDSGLDGMMARRLMENLRVIADQGRIVMVISHSPDRAAELFDKVIVLAKSSADEGRLVFFGTPEKAMEFFEVKSLEGIMGRINYPEEGGEGLADMYIKKFGDLRGV